MIKRDRSSSQGGTSSVLGRVPTDWLGREACRVTELAELGQNDMTPIGHKGDDRRGGPSQDCTEWKA